MAGEFDRILPRTSDALLPALSQDLRGAWLRSHTLPKEAPDEMSRQLLATIGMGDVHAARYGAARGRRHVCPVGASAR